MERVTLQDVATHAGVSMKTVSNVVRHYKHVSPAMRQRVQEAIDALGYRPNVRGRSLATGRSGMLLLAFPDLRWPYFAELAHAFARAGAARGYHILLDETGGTPDGERAVLTDRELGVVDGVILQPQALSAASLEALGGDTPLVFLGEDPPSSSDQVAIDNVAAAEEAVDHLVRLGRRRIGFVGLEADRWSQTSIQRVEGYRNALERAGRPVDDTLLVARDQGDAIGTEVAMKQAIADGLRVDGLLCRDDQAAIGALRALQAHGLEVPRDVAVVGWDATILTASTTPTITSIAPDMDEIAALALDRLLARIDGDDSPGRHVTAGYRLLVRESAPEPGSAGT